MFSTFIQLLALCLIMNGLFVCVSVWCHSPVSIIAIADCVSARAHCVPQCKQFVTVVCECNHRWRVCRGFTSSLYSGQLSFLGVHCPF